MLCSNTRGPRGMASARRSPQEQSDLGRFQGVARKEAIFAAGTQRGYDPVWVNDFLALRAPRLGVSRSGVLTLTGSRRPREALNP